MAPRGDMCLLVYKAKPMNFQLDSSKPKGKTDFLSHKKKYLVGHVALFMIFFYYGAITGLIHLQ